MPVVVGPVSDLTTRRGGAVAFHIRRKLGGSKRCRIAAPQANQSIAFHSAAVATLLSAQMRGDEVTVEYDGESPVYDVVSVEIGDMDKHPGK